MRNMKALGLLALAIIDDVAAVLIIAIFYSAGLDFSGLPIAGAGVLLVLGLQQIGIGTAYAYVIPGAIIFPSGFQFAFPKFSASSPSLRNESRTAV